MKAGTAILSALPLSMLVGQAEAARPVYGAAPDDLAVVALHNFAACAVERNSEGARELLALDYHTPAYQRAMSRFARGHDYCAPNSRLQFNPVLFAGSLAEALLAAGRAPVAPQSAIDTAEPADAVAQCVVDRAADKTRALFATQPASAAETTAFQAIGPTLQSCIASGALHTNKPALRALFALATYRRSNPQAPAQTPASGS